MKLRLFFSLLLFLPVCSGSLHAQACEMCRAILDKGVYDYLQISNSGNSSYELKTYFSSERFAQDYFSRKFGGTLGVFTDNVAVTLGINSSRETLSQFQEKISSAKEVRLDYEYASSFMSQTLQVRVFEEYNKCVANVCGFGFTTSTLTQGDDVILNVFYKKRDDTENFPILRSLFVSGGTTLSQSVNQNEDLRNYETFTFRRERGKELLVNMLTSKGPVTVSVEAEAAGFNADLPVGTIIASFLTWEQFQEVTTNNRSNPNGNLYDPRYAKWAPADGRPVAGSRFASATGGRSLPDTRGVFLRGLNSYDPNGEFTAVPDQQRDQDNRRQAGVFQQDELKRHNHLLKKSNHNTPGRTVNGWFAFDGPGSANEDYTESSGGSETRPKNITVYYYIRIN